MSTTKRSIFRTRAMQHYVQSRDKDVLPRFVSPPVFWGLWIVLGLCLMLGWLAWSIRLPVYIPGIGVIAASNAPGEVQAVLFVSADQQRAVHAGEPVQLLIGSGGLPLLRTITAVAPVPLSPEQARQHYRLDGASALLVSQPSVVIVVALDTQTPASRYAGSIVHAQVQIRRQSLLSFVPLVGPMIGA